MSLFCEINCFHRIAVLCTRMCAQLQLECNFFRCSVKLVTLVLLYRYSMAEILQDTFAFAESMCSTIHTLYLSLHIIIIIIIHEFHRDTSLEQNFRAD